MASILNVDQINNAAGTSGLTLDASTGKASFPNGATLPAGSVLQVVRNSNSSYTEFTTTGTWIDASCSATITPTSASSNILVVTSESIYGDTDGDGQSEYGDYRLLRGSTVIWTSNSSMLSRGGQTPFQTTTFSYLDSPAATSAITYKTQFNRSAASQRSVRMNSWGNANIILMEIAG